MKQQFKVLSLFDGMSCGQIALQRAGIEVTKYYACEIDKYARQVTQENYPNTIQLGDVLNVKGNDLPKIDLLIGGSPCQGFSFAGKQLNFQDPRSKLFFEFVRLLRELKPTNFLLENVKMKREYQDIISEALGVQPILINSNLVSAQNRQRLYWTNIEGVGQPEDRNIMWGHVREHGVDGFYYTEKGLQWLARHSRRKNKTLNVWQETEKAQMVEASHYKSYSSQRFFGVCDLPTDQSSIASMRGRHINNRGVRDDNLQQKEGNTNQYIEFKYDNKSNCLSTVNKDNIVVPFTRPNRVPVDTFFFRYVTPTECERLQTVPDGYTQSVSNTQRYKMLGNGFTVDVITHILKGLKV